MLPREQVRGPAVPTSLNYGIGQQQPHRALDAAQGRFRRGRELGQPCTGAALGQGQDELERERGRDHLHGRTRSSSSASTPRAVTNRRSASATSGRASPRLWWSTAATSATTTGVTWSSS